MNKKTRETIYEVAVVRGGAAGLSTALTLARARRAVIVIDAGHPRNAPASVLMANPADEYYAMTLDDDRIITTQQLIIATGVLDELPGIDGLRLRWGRDVVHCPYCHGWEIRDRHIGVIATSPMSAD